MNQQDVTNISQWLQELLKLMQDTHTQLIDLRTENRQMMDDIKGVSSRVDQRDTAIMRLVETLRSQVDVLKGETAQTRTTAENATSSLDSKLSDLKSALNEVRTRVR